MNSTTDHALTALSVQACAAPQAAAPHSAVQTTTEKALSARPSREDKLDAARAVLAAGLADVRDDPGALAAFLAFRAHFHEYSASNALLIWCQRPSARFCMGYRAWQAHGRQVRKGERGLTILAPVTRKPGRSEAVPGAPEETERAVVGFRTATVFDYAQTDAVADDALVYTPPAPRLNADDPAGLLPRLEAAAAALGYAVVYDEAGYTDGRCSFAERRIMVACGLSPADRAAVLAHELCHALAHDPAATSAKDERQTAARRELQAEGAAFVALAALGLDTSRASLPYLKGWAGDDDAVLGRELTAIDQIARDLLGRVEATEP